MIRVSRQLFYWRRRHGWSLEDAIFTPTWGVRGRKHWRRQRRDAAGKWLPAKLYPSLGGGS